VLHASANLQDKTTFYIPNSDLKAHDLCLHICHAARTSGEAAPLEDLMRCWQLLCLTTGNTNVRTYWGRDLYQYCFREAAPGKSSRDSLGGSSLRQLLEAMLDDWAMFQGQSVQVHHITCVAVVRWKVGDACVATGVKLVMQALQNGQLTGCMTVMRQMVWAHVTAAHSKTRLRQQGRAKAG
jgi:hypothetical protein